MTYKTGRMLREEKENFKSPHSIPTCQDLDQPPLTDHWNSSSSDTHSLTQPIFVSATWMCMKSGSGKSNLNNMIIWKVKLISAQESCEEQQPANGSFAALCQTIRFPLSAEYGPYQVTSVQLTFLSMSLSHMSFIVHPAPLMMNAPNPKSTNILRSGRDPGTALIAMLQPHGQNSNQEPATFPCKAHTHVATTTLISIQAKMSFVKAGSGLILQ